MLPRVSSPHSLGSTIPVCFWYLPALSLIAGFARLVALEEEDLAEAFLGIDLRQAGSV
jgi:hypothetical protein